MINVNCANCGYDVEMDVERYDDHLDETMECPACGWKASLFCFDLVVKEEDTDES